MSKLLTTLTLAVLASPAMGQAGTYGFFHPNSAPGPAPREQALMAYDEARSRTLLAGGKIGGSWQQDTWEFDGVAWSQISPPQQVNFSKPARLVYSPLHGQVLAVTGDNTNGGAQMVVRGWNGASWTVLDANGPPSRGYEYDVAWDRARDVLVMFGGGVNWGVDTWEWDGSSWVQRSTGGPSRRSGHRMVYDDARQVVVLYGGSQLQPFAHTTDTWEWNGIYWFEHFGIASPPVSNETALVYDSDRQRVVLHGGQPNSTGAVYEFDGAQWSVVQTFGGPSTMRAAAAAYERTSDEVVLFGGYTFNSYVGTRTLRFVTGTFGASFPHQVGCPGPAGVPAVAAVGSSRPVLGQTFQLAFGSLPNSPLSLVFAGYGLSDGSWGGVPLPADLSALGMPGCSLFVGPLAAEPLSNINGAAAWSVPIPSNPSLDGVEFFVQGLVLTPGFNAFGAVMSSSLRGVIGTL